MDRIHLAQGPVEGVCEHSNGFRKMLGNSLLAERLSDSQEIRSSKEVVSSLIS
jgi:hypothetical protein